MMKRIHWTTLAATTLVLALDTGCAPPPKGGDEAKTEEAAASGKMITHTDVDDSMNGVVNESKQERFRIDFDDTDMVKGDKEALVTIVEFSDFQCPYCSKFTNTLKEVMKDATDTRVVFKQMPLVSIHPNAMPAAQAALAAFNQDADKGWALHDKLFENARTLTRENIEKYAGEVGLDVEKLKKDLDDKTYEQAVKDDMAYARKMAVNSTPTFFVNGRMLKGRSVDAIKAAIEEEKALAKKLMDKGAKKGEVYARIMKAAKAERKAPKRPERRRPGTPDPKTNFAVPTADRPAVGPADALVTIVEFSDFQCPFCTRVNPTLKKIKETYPNDVRVVFRNLPLPMHKDAPGAARAGLAAHNQGKFWEMHDAMFAKQKTLKPADLEAIAGELGLDIAKFKADMDSADLKKAVADDMATAKKFGARGTPAFFVNGRFISGARPFEQFDSVIKEEKAKAEKFVAEKGVSKDAVYAEMSKSWEKEFKAPPPPPPADFKRRVVKTDGLPLKGSDAAKVTIVECSDFDCPFCKRGAGTVEQVAKEFGDKVAVYYAHNPLPMHKQAEPAHRAAVAAQAQGKFWEMHDKLFADKSKRSEADFVAIATELGLDVDKFKTDWAAAGAKVQADMTMCRSHGVGGVPGFLINGRLMSGAQPFPTFKKVIEEELNGGFEATQKKAAAAGKKAG